MQYVTPTSIINITRSQNNTIKCNTKARAKTIECLGYSKPSSDLKRKLWLMSLIPSIKRIYMLTITFPICTKDDTAHKMLNSFLTNMKKQGYFKTYIWVSERQGNGTIHFHFFITQHTPAEKIQSAMSSTLTTAYRNNISTYPSSLCSNYQGFFFSRNRNGRIVDIKKADKNTRKRITTYLAKYLAKDSEDTELMPILHRRTGCSRDISCLQRKAQLWGDFTEGIHRYIMIPSEARGRKFTELGYTIWIFVAIPPTECIGFWAYVQWNDDIFYNFHAYKDGRQTR